MELNDLRIFCRVAELASFTKAAEQLSMAKGRVSTLVQALEAEVGSRLLQRTTRTVRLTPDGEIFLERCKVLLMESDQLQGMFRPMAGDLRGSVRIDMPSLFAQELIMPKLPELLAAHPLLDFGISINDRRVNIVQEGVDCLIRIGSLPDSDLVARTIGMMNMCNLASPTYLQRYGVPRSLGDLAQHRIIHYANNLRNDDTAFHYTLSGTSQRIPMQSALAVNSGAFLQAACLSGLGIIQASVATSQRLLDAGALVAVLPEFVPPPRQVSLLLPHRRHIAPRVDAVINWIIQVTQTMIKVS
ncbi:MULTISPECIES: LysR family transcriptional regulator [Pectobacterium]|uniref:LysR family transcriptional regulator n=1 Tax=Pectobacterium brasiliense TaxID=180957 RepID=A0AAE2WKQ8_9GAMM|nr:MULTISPECIES: LysR family transcriptional regulator [Pectobacterium]KHS80933.1 LysR family transcriptional regulator [Pectobacterium carotovorum subsp. carotovorum]MBN3053749.1 LysR family transcriptional regulator [Pectobacterium brasiliense]RRN93124.1 LysR family transcriptional regulator [Pectobacterium aquaticum]ULS44809.1 LysR family transcriptional regulator [Pectobacterium carotovorum]